MDDWEAEDFDAKIESLTAKVSSSNFDDEDQPESAAVNIPKPPTAEQIAAQKAQAAKAERDLLAKVKADELSRETPEQRKLREKQEVENDQKAAVDDLFGAEQPGQSQRARVAESGIATAVLKTNEDYTNFSKLVHKKLDGSTTLHVSVFYKALSERVANDLSSETLDQMITLLTATREQKKKTEAKAKQPIKSKKEIKAQQQRHKDVFGGGFEDDEYSGYTDKYDDSYF